MIAGRYPRTLREAFQCADPQVFVRRTSSMRGEFSEPLMERLRWWLRLQRAGILSIRQAPMRGQASRRN